MGLLDDAIREHLELKRRGGADARQLAQLEHEAFGPIRRGDPALDIGPASAGTSAEPAETAPEPRSDSEPSYEDVPAAEEPADDDLGWHEPAAPEPGDEPRWEDEHVASEPEPLPVPEADPVFPLTPAAPSHEAEEAWADEDEDEIEPREAVDQPTAAYSLDELEAFDEPAPDPTPPPPVPPRAEESPPAEEPPSEIAPSDIVAADDEPGEHDVLEETPEFLEETPEHDRLWFEQKPPKDFDF